MLGIAPKSSYSFSLSTFLTRKMLENIAVFIAAVALVTENAICILCPSSKTPVLNVIPVSNS